MYNICKNKGDILIMARFSRNLLIALIFSLSILSYAAASRYDVEIAPRDNFGKAAFRYWQPDDITAIKGIAVLVPGINGDGRGWADDQVWQSFAQRHNFALVACYMTGGYCQANNGSGAALLEALKLFAQKSGHPEVENAPLILWGHSAGGQFNYEFACWKPERVIAFIVNKGGYYSTYNPSPETLQVPAVFFIGANDSQIRIQNITQFFSTGRRQGAPWTLAVEPNTGHEIGGTREFAIPFFDTIIPLRLSAETTKLVDLKEYSGWTGDLTTSEISQKSKSSDTLNAWLPNEAMAKKWQAFVKHDSKAP
jgi:pimeloyl-ACP methyl ester carboxylesterase